MSAIRSWYAAGALIGLSWALAACGQRDAQGEMQWARAALERNPAIEVVAVDEEGGVFTVRSKTSGELRTLKLADLVAGPAPPEVVQAPESSAASSLPAPASPPPAAGGGPAAGTAPVEGEAAAPEAEAAAEATPAGGTTRYTVERSNGRLQITGPGISVASTGRADTRGQSQPVSQGAALAGADDPIVCEGRRFLRIDNRTLEVIGDAVIARNGCELHITNSRIVASGTGIFAIDAKVHLTNTTVQGDAASIEASEGADVYLQSSTMRGLARRLGGATVHDLGGNTWQ